MSSSTSVQVSDPDIYVCAFFEMKNGHIVKTYGASSASKTVQFYDGDRAYGSVSYVEYAQWKRRPDLTDFPNACDSKLPHDFDLLYDLKCMSDLKAPLSNAEMADGLKDLMVTHGITMDQVNACVKPKMKLFTG